MTWKRNIYQLQLGTSGKLYPSVSSALHLGYRTFKWTKRFSKLTHAWHENDFTPCNRSSQEFLHVIIEVARSLSTTDDPPGQFVTGLRFLQYRDPGALIGRAQPFIKGNTRECCNRFKPRANGQVRRACNVRNLHSGGSSAQVVSRKGAKNRPDCVSTKFDFKHCCPERACFDLKFPNKHETKGWSV